MVLHWRHVELVGHLLTCLDSQSQGGDTDGHLLKDLFKFSQTSTTSSTWLHIDIRQGFVCWHIDARTHARTHCLQTHTYIDYNPSKTCCAVGGGGTQIVILRNLIRWWLISLTPPHTKTITTIPVSLCTLESKHHLYKQKVYELNTWNDTL